MKKVHVTLLALSLLAVSLLTIGFAKELINLMGFVAYMVFLAVLLVVTFLECSFVYVGVFKKSK